MGVTTPETLTASMPKISKDENGEYIYDFQQDGTSEKLYAAVQKAVNDAKAEGSDYVYVLAHLGMKASSAPYTYADVLSHTNGIDVMQDGHSHDKSQSLIPKRRMNPTIPCPWCAGPRPTWGILSRMRYGFSRGGYRPVQWRRDAG